MKIPAQLPRLLTDGVIRLAKNLDREAFNSLWPIGSEENAYIALLIPETMIHKNTLLTYFLETPGNNEMSFLCAAISYDDWNIQIATTHDLK